MELYQVLASDEFIRVADVVHFPLSFLTLQVLTVEIRCHLALDLNALDFSKVTLVLQVLPISFVELGTQ